MKEELLTEFLKECCLVALDTLPYLIVPIVLRSVVAIRKPVSEA